MPATVPPDVSKALAAGDPKPDGLAADEDRAFEILAHFFATGVGYSVEMANRPQTLYGIADSPVGLAAWMIDHDERSYQLIARAFAGQPGGLSRDDVLDNVTHYWLTNSGVSSARLYWESHLAFFDAKGVEIPVGVTVFPDELGTRPHGAGRRRHIPSSFTSTRSTRAATSPPGSSRRSSRKRSGRPSVHCASQGG